MLQHPAFIALLALLVLAGSWWFSRGEPGEPEEAVLSVPRDSADYVIHGMHLRTMGEDGKPARVLKSRTVRHYAEQRTTELEAPQVSIVEPGQPPWVIDADKGEVSPDGKQILLAGAVSIARAAAEGKRPRLLQTRDLKVSPEENYAETAEQVTVTSGDSRIESVGMQAWFKHPTRFKLLSKVRGRYVPD